MELKDLNLLFGRKVTVAIWL